MGRPIGSKWVYRLKRNACGEIVKYKSRLVAKGFSEILGQSFMADEVYAPVVSYDTLRAMLSIANQKGWDLHQADISNAYLQSVLPRSQYMVQPKGFEVKGENGEELVCKLQRGLYGTKSGGFHWNKTFTDFMKSIGFEQLTGDTCFKLNPGLAADLATDHVPPPEGEIWVAAYADDLSIASSNKDIYQWFIKLLGNRFPINASESGELDWILSMKVQRDREKGTLKLTQAAAIEKLYMGMGLDGPNARARVVTPMSTERLTKVSEPEFAKEDFDYLSILGSVLHINMLTRPEISFAVNSLTRHASCPGLAHAKALRRLVKYLYDTRHLGVTYYRDHQNCHPEVFESGMHLLTTPNNHMELFADSDYAQDYTRRSTSGMVVMLNGGRSRGRPSSRRAAPNPLPRQTLSRQPRLSRRPCTSS